MSVDMQAIARDMRAEHEALVRALEDVDDAAWDAPTPAPGWSVRDQITHLAFFDGIARVAITDPERFAAIRGSVIGDLQAYVDAALTEGHGRSGSELIAWATDERNALAGTLAELDPSTRVPWFGPDMSAASKATARIMETWAHGQDIVDALRLDRPVSARLRHVAHIGARALPNSFRTRGLEVPDDPVRVELVGPDETGVGTALWTWGPDHARDSVSGDALDFCLVVTQRRHVDDTALVVVGVTAQAWIAIAQAFAGPAGTGRTPGQFTGSSRR